jgi:sugar lactone lactonase YvrE
VLSVGLQSPPAEAPAAAYPHCRGVILTPVAAAAANAWSPDSGAADGLALDVEGRIYVSLNGVGDVVRFDADGTNRTAVVGGLDAAAGLEFGAGPLGCRDLYVASGGAMVRVEDLPAAGADVPWHGAGG